MKTFLFGIGLCICSVTQSISQSPSSPKQNEVIEGGKLMVELIKVLGGKKATDHDTGCKDNYADLCIENQTSGSVTVSLLYRLTAETREVVVLPGGKECCLQAKAGIWTYDLKMTGSPVSIRKGDLKIEGCNNMVMTIK